MYKCIRSTTVDYEKRLFLYRTLSGHWIATEAFKDHTDPVNNGQPKFRTLHPIEDISRPVLEVVWQWFDTKDNTWKGNMKFQTYGLVTAAP